MQAIHPVRSHSAHSQSSSRTPTSAEIDAVIAQAIANAPPPPPPPQQEVFENVSRSVTPLMTNLLPSAVGVDGRVNLFVGNLPYRVRWQDLKDLFRKAGTVLRADVSLGPDNRSRGYGTVLMGSREDAARAIDRYNGYTWQTRTLEVRPDRLPPEYEAQQTHMPHQPQHHQQHPHVHQHQHQHSQHHRPGMFGFHSLPTNGHPYSLSGHLTPQGGPWLAAHGGRPPFPASQGSGSGSHGMLIPGLGHSPAAPPMGLSGSSPVPTSQSPSAMYGSVSLPLSVQNTGPQPYPQLVASPLAGSLSAGTAPSSSTNLAGRSESLTPFSNGTSPDPVAPHLRSTSPAPSMARTGSRPVSNNGQPLSSSSPSKDAINRAPPPNALGTLPTPPFPQPKSVISPTESANGSGASGDLTGISPSLSSKVPPVAAIPQLEGLAHQGMGLGPPETLHDRVIFVSNLPLSMQWQDLKDLLRPAGHIIRADVATDPDGRPRGFGTALFAAEAEATRAVTMFNEREVGGQRIKAHLERQSRPDGPPHIHNGGEPNKVSEAGQRTPPRSANAGTVPHAAEGVQRNGVPPPIDTQSSPESGSRRPSTTATAETSPAAKLPWSLNTSLQQQTPGRPTNSSGHGLNHMTPGPHQHTPNFRQLHHPGPISMPAYPSMDHNNPLSPIGARGMPPMTPSMPGFVFNAYPETPPLHPHFMSPGIGPFSPGIPVSSPNAFGYNPFLNAAPGAPVNRYPAPPGQQGGSAALGTPTTQAFPNGPTPGTIHQYAGPPGQPLNISQTLSSGQGYFPPISTTAPDTPTPKLGPKSIPGASPLNAQERLASNTDAQLASKANKLKLDGDEVENGQSHSLRPASASDIRAKSRSNSNGAPESPVRRSASEARGLGFAPGSGLPGAGAGASSGGGGGRQSLDERRTLAPESEAGNGNGERRASFHE
ncbi:hypothetical protein IAT40_001069 [Kwoniella sp. CBS 6097]